MLTPASKIYVSGQISGLGEPDFTEKFRRAAQDVADHGYIPVNPIEVIPNCQGQCESGESFSNGSYRHSWKCYMKWDIIALLESDAIIMLDNWINSRGSRLERKIAQSLGYPILCFNTDGHIIEMMADV